HAALWYHLELALPGSDLDRVLSDLPGESDDRVISLYHYRKRYDVYFLPRLKAVLDGTDGLWLAYWGDEAKKYDVFDLLAGEGFVRTGTLPYAHLDNPIYAYRYDRASALQDVITRFGDSITLRRIDFPAEAAPGDDLPVLLWWDADAPIPEDYTVSAFLLDSSGVLRAQDDAFPANGDAPTSAWTPGAFVFDGHTLALPDDLPPGAYTVGVKLYTWWDQAILPAAGGHDYWTAGTVTVR
ncbi:MAG: hypothetical protein JW910_22245, partial [Anaerolineae bacterium]|nr:hypothetical protein [Anaerolineae bacterium]